MQLPVQETQGPIGLLQVSDCNDPCMHSPHPCPLSGPAVCGSYLIVQSAVEYILVYL